MIPNQLKPEHKFVAGALLVASLPLFYLLYDLLGNRNDLSSWLAMRIVGCGLLLKNEQLYIDFWDWTQPIVYDVLKGPLILRQWLENAGFFFSADIFMQLSIWFALLLSLLLCAYIAYQGLRCQVFSTDSELRLQLRDLTLALLFSLALSSLILRFDFGDLPHLLILALAPWTLMRWLSYRGCSLPSWLVMTTGALAGCAACFDLPYVFVFIAIEFMFILETGNLRALLRLENLGFVLALGLYLLHLLQLSEPTYTAFWKWTMPLKMLNYEVFDGGLYGPDSCPDRRDILYGVAASLALAFMLSKKNSFFLPLLTITLSGFALYVLEKEGLSRDLSLAVFGSTTVFSLAILILARLVAVRLFPAGEIKMIVASKTLTLTVLSALVTFAFAFSLNLDRDHMHAHILSQSDKSYDDILTVFNNNKVWQDPVMVISDYPAAAYPALLSLNAQPVGYMLWARPLRLFDWIKRHRILDGPMKDFYNYVCQKISGDFNSRTAKLIVLENFERDNLVRAGVAPQLDNNYEKGDECRYYSNNRQPREFVGFWYFDQYTRKPR